MSASWIKNTLIATLCISFLAAFEAYALDKEMGKLENIEITSDSAIILYKEDKAIFNGNVTAKNQEVVIKSDEMIILYNQHQKSLTGKIIAKGNVKITTKEDSAQSECGEYDIEKKLITLKGKVILKQGTKQITGEKLQYDLEKKSASMFSPKDSRVKVVID